MSVPNSASTCYITWAGEETLSFSFRFLSPSDVYVRYRHNGTEASLTRGTHFSVEGTLVDDDSSLYAYGSVSLTSAGSALLSVGDLVCIYRVLDLSQPMILVQNDRLNAKTLEHAADRLTMICQQLTSSVSRADRDGILTGARRASVWRQTNLQLAPDRPSSGARLNPAWRQPISEPLIP